MVSGSDWRDPVSSRQLTVLSKRLTDVILFIVHSGLLLFSQLCDHSRMEPMYWVAKSGLLLYDTSIVFLCPRIANSSLVTDLDQDVMKVTVS